MLIQLWRIKHDTIKKEEKRSLHDRVTHKNLRSNQDERGAITKNMMVPTEIHEKHLILSLFLLYSSHTHSLAMAHAYVIYEGMQFLNISIINIKEKKKKKIYFQKINHNINHIT